MSSPISFVEEVRYPKFRANRRTQVPSVILLHSSGSSARQWNALGASLDGRFRAHAIDLHGHGAQAPWRGPSPLTLADDARLVEPLVAQADGDGVHLVGHSYGAAVALKAATMYPRSVRSVTVYEPVLFRLLVDDHASASQARDVFRVAESIRNRLAQNDPHAAAAGFVDYWSGAGTWNRLSENHRNSIASRMRFVAPHFDALISEPLPVARLMRLMMPALVLTGERTVASTRRLGELLRSAMPFGQHEVMPGLDHMAPITHPAQVNQRITDFLSVQAWADAMPESLRNCA